MSGDYDDGYDIGVRAVGRILRNLIAELRDTQQRLRDTGATAPMELIYAYDQELFAMADRAEARLREVQGE